jgi:hypothetical protein
MTCERGSTEWVCQGCKVYSYCGGFKSRHECANVCDFQCGPGQALPPFVTYVYPTAPTAQTSACNVQ